MARGGYRPNAGRPKGSTWKSLPPGTRAIEFKAIEVAKAVNQTPLEYMLAIMNDPNADPTRRDRIANAAAPFMHGWPAGVRPGKKELARQGAKTAASGLG